MISEKLELLGKGLYKGIPDELNIKSFPTVTELEYVGAEDFDKTMLDVIFPQCIEEKIDFYQLLEIDYMWICRGMRLLNYGPMFTTNVIICNNCGPVRIECQVDLRTIDVKVLPQGFKNKLVIEKDELIDYHDRIYLHLLTMREVMNLREDKLFKRPNGDINIEYARICYSISQIGTEKDITPITAKLEIEQNMSNPDFKVLRSRVNDLTDYGLRGGGRCQCPQCQSNDAAFVALADDRFFRPTVGDLRAGRNDRSIWGIKNSATDTTETV